MSTEENKELVRRCWLECFNKKNLAIIDELVAPEYAWHAPGQEVSSSEGIKQFVIMLLTAFPDMHMTFEDQFGEGDKVASRWTVRCTHQGDPLGIPPTGKPATFTGILISRIADHRIAEEWENIDQPGLLQQLGMIPVLGQAS
jgi:steroid delta-isomerase-like uncharacterized protein